MKYYSQPYQHHEYNMALGHITLPLLFTWLVMDGLKSQQLLLKKIEVF